MQVQSKTELLNTMKTGKFLTNQLKLNKEKP